MENEESLVPKLDVSLFDLNNEFLKVSQYLAECKETKAEPESDMLELYDNIAKELTLKVDSCKGFLDFISSQISMVKEQKEFLDNKKSIMENMQERFKDYLINAAKQTDKKLVGQLYKASVSKTTSVNVVNEMLIPEKYIITKTITSVDKKKIAQDLKNLIAVPGAELSESEFLRWS